MMKYKKSSILTALGLSLSLVLAACSSESDQNPKQTSDVSIADKGSSKSQTPKTNQQSDKNPAASSSSSSGTQSNGGKENASSSNTTTPQMCIRDSIKKGTIPYYGVEGDYYNIGQNQYIRLEAGKVIPYNGCLLVRKATTMYTPAGKKYKTLKAGEQVKVYNQDGQKYDVGNGYYIKKDRNVSYLIGTVKIKKDTTLYKNGKKVRVLKKGERYKVYSLEDNKFDLGAKQYVYTDNSYIEFTKN